MYHSNIRFEIRRDATSKLDVTVIWFILEERNL